MQGWERSWGRDGLMNQHRMTELLQDKYRPCLAWPKRIIGGWWLFGPLALVTLVCDPRPSPLFVLGHSTRSLYSMSVLQVTH